MMEGMSEMSEVEKWLRALQGGGFDSSLARLYGKRPEVLEAQKKRYETLLKDFRSSFPGQREVDLFSAPGRTEVGGNHTDHNSGRVLAAAVDLDIVAAAAVTESGVITVRSEGHPTVEVNVEQLSPVRDERYTSTALVRGVAARFKEMGHRIGGFDAVLASRVPKGSGLSSSAAFEVLVGTVINHLYNGGRLDALQLAQIGQYSENVHFGKPCGLMDQTTSAVGGFVTIDFADQAKPVVRKINFDFAASGYRLVITNTGGDHTSLNEDYAALEHEMKDVARALGGQVLREFSGDKVLQNMKFLRTKVSDRAILRALHFYADDRRVADEVDALEKKDFGGFLRLVIESGYSSWMLCQNCYIPGDSRRQEIALALAVSERILKGRGAWRVHGGGFAGTIQAFVPEDKLPLYLQEMGGIFGPDACYELQVRSEGAMKIARVRES
ncbi:MAG: galactokinase [Bacillota bacterium]